MPTMRSISKVIGLEVIALSRKLTDMKDFALANQVLRSGTSIGANISESEYATTTPDYIAKMQIALKECNETIYWLELLRESGIYENQELEKKCWSIIRMGSKAVKTAKAKLEAEKQKGK